MNNQYNNILPINLNVEYRYNKDDALAFFDDANQKNYLDCEKSLKVDPNNQKDIELLKIYEWTLNHYNLEYFSLNDNYKKVK